MPFVVRWSLYFVAGGLGGLSWTSWVCEAQAGTLVTSSADLFVVGGICAAVNMVTAAWCDRCGCICTFSKRRWCKLNHGRYQPLFDMMLVPESTMAVCRVGDRAFGAYAGMEAARR